MILVACSYGAAVFALSICSEPHTWYIWYSLSLHLRLSFFALMKLSRLPVDWFHCCCCVFVFFVFCFVFVIPAISSNFIIILCLSGIQTYEKTEEEASVTAKSCELQHFIKILKHSVVGLYKISLLLWSLTGWSSDICCLRYEVADVQGEPWRLKTLLDCLVSTLVRMCWMCVRRQLTWLVFIKHDIQLRSFISSRLKFAVSIRHPLLVCRLKNALTPH